MPGNETKNYDLVIEFAEQAYRDLLGTLFDSDAVGSICWIVEELRARIPGFPEIPCGTAFIPDVFFDRPTDITLPAGARDMIDIRVHLGEGGSLGSLRIVAGLDVNNATVAGTQLDIIRINFAEKTYFVSANITGLPDPAGLVSGTLSTLLRDFVRETILFPVPVNRGTDSSTEIRSADIRIVDDASSEDKDTSAILLTFGGGAPGNRNAFTRGFIPVGETGAIAVDFDWLCRIIRPRLEDFLGLDRGTFSPPCSYVGSVEIDDERDVYLTRLQLSLVDGAIQVTASVRKSGTGYTATGTVRGRIRIEVREGNLVVQSEVDDPEIDLDLDWWVYLVAGLVGAIVGAIVGALVGGVIGGIIGAIVGAVLIPLMTWLATEIIEGLIEDIASRIIEAIRSLNLEVPAYGLNVVFQEVFIDDIVIGCRFEVQDTTPIRSEGTLLVINGQGIDLDNGVVGEKTLHGADIVWEGMDEDRKLRTLCTAGLARTSSASFKGFSRYKMYGLAYESPGAIPLEELSSSHDGIFGDILDDILDEFGDIFGFDVDGETRLVYGVRTNEDRYSLIQVVEVEDDFIRMNYKTFEKRVPKVEILGGFRYESEYRKQKEMILRPESIAMAQVVHVEGSKVPTTKATQNLKRTLEPRKALAKAPAEMRCEIMKFGPNRLPKYFIPGFLVRVRKGRFNARTQGIRRPFTIEWFINKKHLDRKGNVAVNGLNMSYTTEGENIALIPKNNVTASFELKVVVRDAEGNPYSDSMCVEFVAEKTVSRRGTLNWTAYQREYRKTFGSVQAIG